MGSKEGEAPQAPQAKKRLGRPPLQVPHPAKTHVQLTKMQHQDLKELAEKIGGTTSDVIRRAIELCKEQYSGEIPMTLQMKGDAKVLDMKLKCLTCFRFLQGEAMAAQEAGVTRSTVAHWMRTDPVFRELAEEAHAYCVEKVEAHMYERALSDGKDNFQHSIAIQNARNPEYGNIRPQMILRILGPFVERVMECAAKYIPEPDDIERFGEEVGQYTESVMLSQGARKRK